ncbi:MAG TPA: DUF1127 domain-containing protein [Hyphomicrobiaceae bacterium]|nr:DUF1127 domain-containing protein [Hyphomicrobiaceae bacterium]
MSHSTYPTDTFGNEVDVAASARGLFSTVRRALAIRRQRRALMALDDRMLADIGLSQADAWQEAHRSFFDLAARQPTRR